MIFYVYMLKSINNKIIKTYVGYTNNLNLRLKKHITSPTTVVTLVDTIDEINTDVVESC